MIKIFDSTDKIFNTNGNIAIIPLKCREIKKKSLNGWYLNVEVSIKYKDYIEQDKICVVKTKSKLQPQPFRIKNIEKQQRKIRFTAEHIAFDSTDYFLVDVRSTNLDGINTLNYINNRIDNVSPYTVFSNISNTSTAYFIRKNLLEAWAIIEERWQGIFDFDCFNVNFINNIGIDRGEIIAYGKNLQGIRIFEDWSNVVTRLYPVGKDGLMLPEQYIESDIQYDKPYTKTIPFETEIEEEEQTQENLIEELREKAKVYLEKNKVPMASYDVTSDINQEMEIGDTIHVKHPLIDILTEVLEYEYDILTNRVVRIVFGNFTRDAKTKFDNIKNTINEVSSKLTKQDEIIEHQTNIINSLNKNGYVYIDKNEILILDDLPKENAKNVWRWGLGGLGFSSNGYEGPFETAITMDGQINANFITTGQLNVNRIEGLANTLNSISIQMDSIVSTVESTQAQTETNTDNIETLRKTTEQIQTDSEIKLNVISETIDDGVPRVKTTSGTFDENGLLMEKSGEEMSNLIDNKGIYIKRDNEEMLGADNTGVRAENITVRKYFIVGNNLRIENYKGNRTRFLLYWGLGYGKQNLFSRL